MSGINVVPLFTKKGEPPAILQDDTSGEYYNEFFENWKEAVHFVAYMQIEELKKNKKSKKFESFVKEWRKKYFDEEDEETFIGDFNQFQNKDIYVVVSNFAIDGKSDLKNASIWNLYQERPNLEQDEVDQDEVEQDEVEQDEVDQDEVEQDEVEQDEVEQDEVEQDK
jgi:hypothetical protein